MFITYDQRLLRNGDAAYVIRGRTINPETLNLGVVLWSSMSLFLV